MHRFLRPVRLILPVLAALGAAAPAQQSVRVATVERAEVQQHDRVTGSLRAAHEVVIAALEEGALVDVRVKEAAFVKRGDVLASTDARRLEAQAAEVDAEIARARAEVLQRRAELANAERDVEALAAAAQKNAVSERQLRNARTEAEVAAARIAAAEGHVQGLDARKALLRVRLDDALIRAPFDGRIVARHAEPGQWIRPGDPVVTLASTGIVEAWLEVPERHADAARALAASGRGGSALTGPLAGTNANALAVEITAAGRSVTARGVRLVPQVHARARTFALVADLDDAGGGLVPGMSVSAWLPVSQKAAQLLVPRDALVRRPGQTSLFRIREADGAPLAEQVAVSVLFETESAVAVAGPLAAGERVVVEGNERLFPNIPVSIVPEGPRTAAPAEPRGERVAAIRQASSGAAQ